ncbi:MAG: Zn-ribbon domain-containing OB-fold protein [Acidimicrobiales bacterium]
MIDSSVCAGCHAAWFPEVIRCANCGSFDVVPVALSDDGTVRSFTWVHSKAHEPSPWGLAHIETADGVLLVGLTEGRLDIGTHATVQRFDDGIRVYTRPVES